MRKTGAFLTRSNNRVGPTVQRRAPHETTFAYVKRGIAFVYNAVLITHKDALTSAAAVYGMEDRPGAFNLLLGPKWNDHTISHNILHIHRHTHYNESESYADIAVLNVGNFILYKTQELSR